MLRWTLLCLITLPAMAAPQSLEVWFISHAKKAQLLELLNRPQYVYHQRTAALECQEMGDYCFDPQYGLYRKDDESLGVNAGKALNESGSGNGIPSAKSLDRDLINCDKSNYFDVFCGKARQDVSAPPKISFELWIDTSSSMREFDFTDKEGGCFRKSLMKRLDATCPFNRKVNVMMFDTSIKQAGDMDSLCLNQGLNDYKRLMDWIERSDAKKLVVITDIYELHKDFSDFVEAKHGRILGDKDPLPPAELLNLVDDLAKSCK